LSEYQFEVEVYPALAQFIGTNQNPEHTETSLSACRRHVSIVRVTSWHSIRRGSPSYLKAGLGQILPPPHTHTHTHTHTQVSKLLVHIHPSTAMSQFLLPFSPKARLIIFLSLLSTLFPPADLIVNAQKY
jgi:hypothetical protein